MLGKWISCRVPGTARERFSAAQRDWSTISDQPGLVGQVGGWDPATGSAHLLGLWTDAAAYGRFMRERHDTVTAGNGQSASSVAIETATGEVILDMGGDAVSLSHALEQGALLRVADCRLLTGREEYFLDVQRKVWAPGMAAAGGMLAGVVTMLESHRYLVTTLWASSTAHQSYSTQHVPTLRVRAGLAHYLDSMTSHVLPLERAWRILPDHDHRAPASTGP